MNKQQKMRDIIDIVLESHRTLCEVKGMPERVPFGQDPCLLYSLGLTAECGELANEVIRVLRVGGGPEEKKIAIEKEIADVFIYAILLAHTNDVDIHDCVSKKAAIVVQRAMDGYYGGKLDIKPPTV